MGYSRTIPFPGHHEGRCLVKHSAKLYLLLFMVLNFGMETKHATL